jgi:predicted DNA-binding transcriptional regulator AlpA
LTAISLPLHAVPLAHAAVIRSSALKAGGKGMALNLNPLQVFDRSTTLEILGLDRRTFDRLEARGEAPPKIQLSPNRVGYRASDLQHWQDSRLQRKTA